MHLYCVRQILIFNAINTIHVHYYVVTDMEYFSAISGYTYFLWILVRTVKLISTRVRAMTLRQSEYPDIALYSSNYYMNIAPTVEV